MLVELPDIDHGVVVTKLNPAPDTYSPHRGCPPRICWLHKDDNSTPSARPNKIELFPPKLIILPPNPKLAPLNIESPLR